MEEKYLNKIYYRGKKFKVNLKTIIFIHGLSGSSSAWLPYEKIFEKKFNILSLDLRGHGKSFRPSRLKEYDINLFTEDIYKIVKKEKIKNFVIVSHSFGNLIALNFARKYENLMNGLILISVDAAPGKRFASKAISPFLSVARLICHLPVFGKKSGHVDYGKHVQTGDWNIKRSFADISNTGLKSFVYSTISGNKSDMRTHISKIKIPVLIIHGGRDTIFPINRGENVHKLIKKSKFIVFENSDHIIVLNAVKKLSNEIKKFMKSLK
jgi:pimeloyl-ACP methyl ester carboxylesterase